MKILNTILKSDLMKGSILLFVMINLFNILNYVFHFITARLLGPADYGILAVLMSIMYILGVPTEAIQTIISRYTSKFNIKREFGRIKDLFARASKKMLKIAIICFIVFIPIGLLLSKALKINFSLLILTGLIIFPVFLLPVTRGILQGRKKFGMLGANMVGESVIKVILATALILVGLRVYGAIGAIVIALFLTFLISIKSIKEVIHSKRKWTEMPGIYSYSLHVFLTIFIIIFMMSIDIILAKRFFPDDIAGKYAVVSMLGKMIFFATSPIGKAMFPVASEKFENGKKDASILYKSLKIVSVICLIAVAIFLFVPELIIKILFGTQYTAVSGILVYIGLAFSFLSIANLILLYLLSAGKIKKAWILFIFPIIQIVLLSIFNANLEIFSIVLMFSNLIIMLASFALLWTKDRKKK